MLPLRLAVVLLLVAGALLVPALSGWASAPAAPAAADQPQAQVVTASRFDTSPPLRDIPVIAPQPGTVREMQRRLPLSDGRDIDSVVQSVMGPPLIPTPILTFEGVNNRNGVYPPDTNGDIGPNHYMQWVNLSFQIFNRAGGSLYGPANGNTLFSGFGGPCETTNDGDPIALYDEMADRWLASQFAFPNFPSGPFYQCIAVSQTGDPTGAWYRYEYQTSATKLNDYPKFGVWPDGYYMTANLFLAPTFGWAGTGVYALDRARMLNGQVATMQLFELPPADWGGMLPSDLDGDTLPPAGAPNYMVEVVDGAWDPGNWPNDELHFHRFHVDWVNPGNTTFNITPIQMPVAAFDGVLCAFGPCVPQPGTAQRLDTLGDRLMYRLAYRNFGTHESLVVNHTVDVGTNMAAIRWYELRNPAGSPPTLYQQGTYAPADGLHRWMASIAQDRQGNMMLGFSTSNGTAPNYPSIAYTGRLVGDPLGQMPQGEAVMTVGTGSQTGTAGRWGDYSMMGIDPVDDCTFWYTNEYLTTTGGAPWRTRIGYMKFPNCSGGTPTPTATGPQPTATNTPAPPSPTPTACGSPAQWTAGPNFPSTMVRAWGAWFPPNNRFYSMGGRMSDAVGSDLLNPHEYNPATNAWTVKAAAFPDGDVNNMVGGVLNGPSGWRIYTVGGSAAGGTTATARVMVYDPVADTLTELTTDPWTGNAAGDTLPGGAAVHNNRLYVFGGFQINIGMTNTIWEFNPMAAAGARWTQKTATLPEALGYIPATTIGNFIYTAGGSAWDGTTIADTDFSYRYDPVADTLTTITSIPRFTAETRALTVDGTMWVLGGGRDAPNPSNEVNVYDPATNSWSLGPSFNLARRNFAADIDPASGEIYIAGGYAPTTATDSMEIYTPEVPCATATPTVAPATATATAAPSWQLYLPAIFLNADTP